jgi:hypothetical protein
MAIAHTKRKFFLEEKPMSFRILMLIVGAGKAAVALAGGMMAVLGALDLLFGTNTHSWYAEHVRNSLDNLVIGAGAVGFLLGIWMNR